MTDSTSVTATDQQVLITRIFEAPHHRSRGAALLRARDPRPFELDVALLLLRNLRPTPRKRPIQARFRAVVTAS
jgi:hypothetical protein